MGRLAGYSYKYVFDGSMILVLFLIECVLAAMSSETVESGRKVVVPHHANLSPKGPYERSYVKQESHLKNFYMVHHIKRMVDYEGR
jgi:hypothetical protein